MATVNEPPEDVLIDILSRLPAKSVLRFKSVSKRWYSLIQNPNFISLHRNRTRLFHCVSLVRTVDDNPYHWSMHLLSDQTSIHDLDLSFTRPHLHKDFSHQGSCNGLMCLSFNSNIVICNPATREYRLLPQPPCHTWHTNYLGFAFDSNTKDYKVVRVATLWKTYDHRIHIYCMSADSWKELVVMAHNHDFTGYHHHPCTSLDGVFYWLSSNVYYGGSKKIDALDTVEGSFERRSLPVGIRSHSQTNLCLLNDSLTLVVPLYDNQLGETQFDVWLMDKYGVQECWTKKYTIGPILGSQRPFGFQPNNEVLMTGCDDGLIVAYNHITGDIEEYKQLCNLPKLRFLRQVFQYSESLVSVKRRLD